MMRALGLLEIDTEETIFRAKRARPALSRSSEGPAEFSSKSPTRRADAEGLSEQINANIDLAFQMALHQVARCRTSTTLARLAHLTEATGDKGRAVELAREALALCGARSTKRLLDPGAVRLALEVLLRQGKIEEVLDQAPLLKLDASAVLLAGTALADRGLFGPARELLASVSLAEKDTVLAYMLVSEERDEQAIPLLRAALRRSPDDANSSHNLSIAFWRLGAQRKGLAAAQRATRVAPGRQDLSIHYLELLLAAGRLVEAEAEVDRLLQSGVTPTARLLIIQARARLGLNDFKRAEKLLVRAGALARSEGDEETSIETESNLIRLRVVHGGASRVKAIDQLVQQQKAHPRSEIVVANLARLVDAKRHAGFLRTALDDLGSLSTPRNTAFVEYQIATLEGDNEKAADRASDWYRLEPKNSYARSAALTALGIGAERWQEAAVLAVEVVHEDSSDDVLVNNAAYVLAMSGDPARAIDVLERRSSSDPILRATLGLAYLAAGQIARGMKLYREAANSAGNQDGQLRSLMTAYQALVVRQLGLLDTGDSQMVVASALPPIDLPDGWKERPEFLRLMFMSRKRGYGWPLVL